jgi:cobalamin synthase
MTPQDEEDAKQGLYNWLAQSTRLLTLPRLLFGTGTAVLVPVLALGVWQAAAVCLTVVLVTAAAGYYATAIIGGVVGDFLGATIQVMRTNRLAAAAARSLPCAHCPCWHLHLHLHQWLWCL